MSRIAITGGIACGKSLAGSILRARGFEVLDADDVAHQVLNDADISARIVEIFSSKILDEDGSVNRSMLGRIVFANPEKLALLNSIMHPEIIRRCEKWIAEKIRFGRTPLVIVPLLFEVGYSRGFDAIITVSCPEHIQCARLAGRGLSMEEAYARIRSQMPLKEKERLADYVIWNEGNLKTLEKQVDLVTINIAKV